MLLDLDLRDRTVLVIGDGARVGRIVARYKRAGAHVSVLSAGTAGADHDRHEATAAASGVSVTSAALIVDATGGVDAYGSLLSMARESHALLIREDPTPTEATVAPEAGPTRASEQAATGRITLVGAGPGDPQLHTVAARQALADADVVLVDRLAEHADAELVTRLAPGAELIDVGKLPGHHKVTQRGIQALLVEHALAGRHVVRLKGGDPFVFGRGGEEVTAARAAGVPVTVIPGITSAIAVPGRVGIPVTHRETARAFTVISGHDPIDDATSAHLAGLGAQGGTIVVLMGVGTLVQTVTGLQRAGMDPATPVAIIQEGTTDRERVIRAPLASIARVAAEARVASPAVIVIGPVVEAIPILEPLTAVPPIADDVPITPAADAP